jgi:hypothetical protein
MRKIILHFFLFSYIIVMIKPVMPYITDGIAHLLFFKDHVETVHSHHGKLHIHAELAAAEKSSSPEKNNTIQKKYSFDNEYLILKKNKFTPFSTSANLFKGLKFHQKDVCMNTDFPPPKM